MFHFYYYLKKNSKNVSSTPGIYEEWLVYNDTLIANIKYKGNLTRKEIKLLYEVNRRRTRCFRDSIKMLKNVDKLRIAQSEYWSN